MRNGFKWTALLFSAILLTGCAQKAESEAPQLLEPAGVQSDMAAAYIGEIYNMTCYSASIKPYVEALSFKVSGEVMSVNGSPGMMTEEGDVLIELDQVSLQERAEQLQQELNYAQQDGEYSDTIAELDIEILEAELSQLEKSEATLKENEAALKEKETTLKENISALREKEAALKENISALREKESALKENKPTPEVSEPTPEESEPAPEESEPAPEESELALVEKEIELAEKELALVKNEITIAEAEITQAEEEIPLVTEEIELAEREIALKENEITQKQALLRQDKELRELELENTRKELAEIRETMTANVLHAPFTGRIIYGEALAPGSWVSAEDPVVFLADDSKLSIVCGNIPETTIESADRIYAHIGAKEYELKYVPIDPDEYTMMVISGAEVTTKFEIIASEEELAELEAGQYAQVCLWHDYVPDALLVPSGAVMHDSAGNYVYVDENGSRVKRSVETGEATISYVQIVEGLEEGDVVYVKD